MARLLFSFVTYVWPNSIDNLQNANTEGFPPE